MSFKQAQARPANKLDLEGWPERIRRLLEITEAKRNHELLLTVKNLRELGGSPFPYIIPIVPHSLPAKVIEGEHFVLTDLLKLVPGNSSQVIYAQEGQTEAATRTLVRSNRVTQPRGPQPTPQSAKKRETRVQQTKTAGARLEAFVDWTGVVDGEPVEEEIALPSGLLHGCVSGLQP